MTDYEMKQRLEELVRNGESCATCDNKGKAACRYYLDESNIPFIAGEPRCVEHSRQKYK